jgi:hypothetical protein
MEGSGLKVPGPGNYQLQPIIGKEGLKSSMHATIDWNPEKRENSYKPGPGNYSPDPIRVSKKKAPGWKMGSSSRDDPLEKMKKGLVSPDKYNPDFNANSTMQLSSKWGFGSEPRRSMENN